MASMKPAKQTVTYDSSTGKMYEELGSSGAGAAAGRSSYFHNYQASYGGGAGAGAGAGAGRGQGRCTRAWGRPPPSTCPPTPAPATWAHTTGRCRTTNTRHALTELHFAFIWIVMTKV